MKIIWIRRGLVTVTFLLIGLFLIAAGTKPHIVEGQGLESEGKIFLAAKAYVRALNAEPRNRQAKKSLRKIADMAIERKHEEAMTLEKDFKPGEAIAELTKLKTFQASLVRHGIGVEGLVNVDGQIEGVTSRATERLYREAEEARKIGLWGVSIAHLQEIELLRPGLPDVNNQLAAAWEAWGQADLEKGRLRSASDRFVNGAKVPGGDRSTLAHQAASLLSALGRASIEQGACRRGVADFRSALAFVPDSISNDELSRAKACAATYLFLKAPADKSAKLDSAQVSTLKRTIREGIAADASEFLVLHDSEEAMKNREAVSPLKPVQFRVDVQVTSVNILRSSTTAYNRETSTQKSSGETLVSYREYDELFKGRMSGSVMISKKAAGGDSINVPITVDGRKLVRWTGNSATVVSRQDLWDPDRLNSVQFSFGAQGRARVNEIRKKAEKDLSETLIQSFAKEVSHLILSVVDAEPLPSDPQELPENH